MKEIIDLEGKEYLAKTYKLAKAYKQCIVDTGAVAAATQPAPLTGNETPEEKANKIAEQGAKNAEEMMRMIYEEHADMTEKVLPLFVALDNGEELPPTRKLAAAMSRALSDDDFMAFLRSLM